MTFNQLLENYFQFLWETFMYDMDVYSQGWMYYLLLIPAFFYTIFFVMKWGILLTPFWFPFAVIMRLIAFAIFPKAYLESKKDE